MPSTAKSPREQFTKALRILEENGNLDHPAEGYWRSNTALPTNQKPVEDKEEAEVSEDAEVTVGGGPESIYGWYLPAYRELAALKGEDHFPIKVGHTARSPNQRIEESWGMLPEKPHLGFHFRCSNSVVWERMLHSRLALNGRHVHSAVGKEWFLTNLEELAALATEDIAINDPKKEAA